MILSPADLQELTGARRSDAQARELDHLGIPYRRRRDRTIIVIEEHLNAAPKKIKQAPPALRLP